jgi:signal transduction histidine kinase
VFKALSSKVAGAQALVFFTLGVAFMLATDLIFDSPRPVELATHVGIGVLIFSALAALLVFNFLTPRVRALAIAVDRFRDSGFTQPIRLSSANPGGDDIGRLAAAVEAMSERIVEQLALLEQTEVRRRELLANVSHDLRTPLASMQGYLEILLLKHGTLRPDEERSYIEVAAKHSERLGRLIRDLFQLTKLEAHELEPQCECFPIAELVQDVVEKFQLAANKRNLRLSIRLTDRHAQLHADIGMIESVLENLIENAMRHTPAGGAICVEVVPLQDARVAVRVADTGRGIPADELPTIFDRYYRVDRGEASDAGSTGLGLAITRHIIDLHGGTIQVDSVLGEGTTFTFELPLAAAGALTSASTAQREWCNA